MAGNALVVDGHPWWGARLYDPTTTTFLSPDPLAPPVGALWANNPYDYANNNPLTLTDPLGTHPVTDDQLAGLTHPVRHWWTTHKDRILSRDFLIGAGLLIGGIAVAATGFGGPLGAAIISGALMSGGFSASSQKYATGDVNWRTVIKDGIVGGVVGGVGTGTANIVGSQVLKHSDTAAALVEKYAADTKVSQAGASLLTKLNGRTAADNALKLAAKSGDSNALETMYMRHFAGAAPSSFAAANTQYIMDTAMSHDKHFSASDLAQANGNAIFGVVMSLRGNATVRPNISTSSGEWLKRGPALVTDTMGVKQQFSTFGREMARGAIADAATQEISTAMKGQDPRDFADGFTKKTARTLGNAAHASFPGLHVAK
ncbi:RHS repeat-associated core domain-containing protein [Cutibacterium porci]|nr:RHS repeat-associated core domain-containing protein [Cutibacterium porci]